MNCRSARIYLTLGIDIKVYGSPCKLAINDLNASNFYDAMPETGVESRRFGV